MKVLVLAQLEMKPRLVDCEFSFPCRRWRVDQVFTRIRASGMSAIRMRTEIQRLQSVMSVSSPWCVVSHRHRLRDQVLRAHSFTA